MVAIGDLRLENIQDIFGRSAQGYLVTPDYDGALNQLRSVDHRFDQRLTAKLGVVQALFLVFLFPGSHQLSGSDVQGCKDLFQDLLCRWRFQVTYNVRFNTLFAKEFKGLPGFEQRGLWKIRVGSVMVLPLPRSG